MTTTTANTRTCSREDRERTGHVLLHDDLGLLTLRRLRPWHRMLARCAAARLDRKLAAGTSPLYHEARGDDLDDIIDKVMRALTL